ncbi:MAG: SGNH/GDSL hydrolase family protein [Verrucomicrobiota bacterium]
MKIYSRAFLLVIGILILAEISVRLFWARNMSGRFEYGYHPTAGFVEDEDSVVKLVRAGGRRFRPQSFRMPKPEKTFRIFVIGDSVPRGPSLEEAYPYLLAENLKKKNIAAEALNLAVAGYGARRSQIVLKQALRYQPDLVILHLNGSNEYEDEREYRRAKEFTSWHPKNWLMKSLLLRRLYEIKTEQLFWKLLPQDIRSQTGVSDADAEIASSKDEKKSHEWKKRVEEVSLASVRLAREAKVPILVLAQAVAESSSGLNDQGLDALLVKLEKEGAMTLSMKEIFQLQFSKDDFSDGSHLRPSGHQKIAAAMTDKICQSIFP